MHLRATWFLIPLLILAIEGGVQAWRFVGKTPPTTSVFCWKGEELVTTAPPPFGRALEAYRADRGANKMVTLPDGQKMTLFYFEWDRIDLGPFIDVGGHDAEVCNVRFAGFKLLQGGGHRTYRYENGEALCFNYVLLADPDGKPVYVYKIPWIQGYGAWVEPKDRFSRLRRSFIRHCGAARVLEAGFFGAASEDEAWGLFQREVLEKLERK